MEGIQFKLYAFQTCSFCVTLKNTYCWGNIFGYTATNVPTIFKLQDDEKINSIRWIYSHSCVNRIQLLCFWVQQIWTTWIEH